MIIREQQMLGLEGAAAQGFEGRMLDRIREYFPKHVPLLGETQCRLLIQLALEKARKHDLTLERNVALFLDLMCLLGSAFDSDPQMPWTVTILADRSFATQDARADLLHQRGWAFAQRVAADFAGLTEKDGSSHLIPALREIGQSSLIDLPGPAVAQFASDLRSKLSQALPVRCETIGDVNVKAAVKRAIDSAFKYGIRNPRGLYLFATLSLVIGAGFDKDPQTPWASQVLSAATEDPVSRTKRLHFEAMECLRRWWNIGAGTEA